MRALFLLLCVASLILFLSARAGIARADGAMLDLGQHLMTLSEAGISNERGVLLNDQVLHLKVFTVEHEMESVLDYYESWCHGNNKDFGGQEQQLQLLEQSPLLSSNQSHSWTDLVRRQTNHNIGYVACLKHGVSNVSSQELIQKLVDFSESGNLKDLGQFHYVAVTSIENKTRVVTTWTENDFFPYKIFPTEGDAAGFDPRGFSRPPTGRRILSAGELGHEETLTLYVEGQESIEELTDYYKEDFALNHWQVLSSNRVSTDNHMFMVQRGPEMRIISILKEKQEPSSVTVLSTR